MPQLPPTRNPADCICGGATGTDGTPRLDIVCPCCDGECVVDSGELVRLPFCEPPNARDLPSPQEEFEKQAKAWGLLRDVDDSYPH